MDDVCREIDLDFFQFLERGTCEQKRFDDWGLARFEEEDAVLPADFHVSCFIIACYNVDRVSVLDKFF